MPALHAYVNTPTELPSPTETVPNATRTEADSARLKEITRQLAEDVRPLVERLSAVPDAARPLVERARPWADVFLPILDEFRPLLDDLRPVTHDLRALVGELLSRVHSAAAPHAARSARRLASIRSTLPSAGPSLSVPAIRAPRLTPAVRLPRPGRWTFRAIAIGIIVFTVGNASLRDAMVEEVSWTRSVLQTIELPAIQIPTVELPTIQIPSVELPTFQMPTFELPTFELPSVQLSGQEPAAPPKLAPAQFEVPPLGAYRAAFETQASYPTVAPNSTVEWVVALRNTGSAGWYRGVAGAQAALALTDGTEAAVQTTAYVAPGQVGWFVVRFRAPAGPGAHEVALFPRIDGRGELPNLGIYALVTVR